MVLNITITCKHCNKPNNVDPTKTKVLNLEFCNEECNEAYFLEKGMGLIPQKYINDYYIAPGTGRAVLKIQEDGNEINE